MRLTPIRTLAIRSLALAGLLLTAWPATAQMTREDIELRNQIYELQQQVQLLQQQMSSRGGNGGSYLGQPAYQAPQSGGGNDVVAQLLTEVQSLEQQVRDLRGRVDEAQNELQKQGADLGKRIDDLAFQVQHPESAGGAPTEAAPPAGPESAEGPPAGSPAAPPPGQVLSPPPAALGSTRPLPTPPGQPPAAPARRTPELAMQDGNLALAHHDYPAAEAAAREVLNNFRTSPRAYDAQYLLAQALAAEHQYSQAAIAYDDTYNRNRKGARAPEALVGLANALAAINEKRAACETVAKLHAEFPQVRQDVRQAAFSVQQRAGCH
jgi:TolA-binding protein